MQQMNIRAFISTSAAEFMHTDNLRSINLWIVWHYSRSRIFRNISNSAKTIVLATILSNSVDNSKEIKLILL